MGSLVMTRVPVRFTKRGTWPEALCRAAELLRASLSQPLSFEAMRDSKHATESAGKLHSSQIVGAKKGAIGAWDAELAALVEVWPDLKQDARLGILQLAGLIPVATAEG